MPGPRSERIVHRALERCSGRACVAQGRERPLADDAPKAGISRGMGVARRPRMSNAPEPVSPVDAAWLQMDQKTNAMVITSALLFDGPLDHARLEERLRSRLLAHRRFVQRIEPSHVPLMLPRWVHDDAFDLRNHLHHVALPDGADEADLARLISDRLTEPLPHDRPLYRIDHVAGVTRSDGRVGSAIVARIHHCVADGVALVGVLASLVDETEGLPPPAVVGLPPNEGAEHLLDRVRAGVDHAKTLGRLLLIPGDRPTPMSGPLSLRKEAAWSKPIPLAQVKAVGRALGAKVNDVLSAAVTGAVRAHLHSLGALSPGEDSANLRALVPVFFQGATDATAGNHFGLVFLDLPIGLADARARVEACHARMDTIKRADDATVAFGVLAAMGVAAGEIEKIAIDIFTRKATLLLTNVPGPPVTVHIAGRALTDVVVWAPVSGHVGVSVTLVSYGGNVRMSVSSDARLSADPATLVAAFETELDRMSATLVTSA